MASSCPSLRIADRLGPSSQSLNLGLCFLLCPAMRFNLCFGLRPMASLARNISLIALGLWTTLFERPRTRRVRLLYYWLLQW